MTGSTLPIPTAPQGVQDRVGAVDGWAADGRDRWLTPSHTVYLCVDESEADRAVAAALADPLTWPGLIGAGRWLMQPTPSGLGAERPELHGEIGGLAVLAGHELRRIHSLPVDDIADEEGWPAIERRVAVSPVNPADLAEPFSRYDFARLTELWREGRPANDDVVVCHGQPRLEHMMVEAGVVTGWAEPRRAVIADRHLDLAVAHRSIQTHLGNDAVFRFYEAYDSDPSLPSLEHYLLADLLIP